MGWRPCLNQQSFQFQKKEKKILNHLDPDLELSPLFSCESFLFLFLFNVAVDVRALSMALKMGMLTAPATVEWGNWSEFKGTRKEKLGIHLVSMVSIISKGKQSEETLLEVFFLSLLLSFRYKSPSFILWSHLTVSHHASNPPVSYFKTQFPIVHRHISATHTIKVCAL